MLTRLGARAARAYTAQASSQIQVIHDVARQQFLSPCGEEYGVLKYEKDPSGRNEITFTNTDVPKAYQGKGVAKALAHAAFSHAYEKHYNVTIQCHYLAKYYAENADKFPTLKVKTDTD